MSIESVDNNQKLHFNEEKDGLELKNAQPQEIPEDQGVI